MTAKVAMICGVLGALWILALTLIGGATYPGYSHVANYISELGANGAPHGWLVSYAGFLPAGLLLCGFALFAFLAVPRSALSALGFIGIFLFSVGYIAASYFRCDEGCRPETLSFSQVMHNTFGLLGYVLAPLCLLLLGLAARKWPNAGTLPFHAYIAAALALVGFATMAPDSPFAGASQRVLEAAVLSWVVACGLYLGRAR